MGAVLLCAGGAPAPSAVVGEIERSARPEARVEVGSAWHEGVLLEEADEGTVAGGKLLLTKRLKLIIKYHAVISA